MNDILKQRLVGALVIVVLAVVFWPMVFVGPEREPLDRSTQVPSIPSLEQMQLDAPAPQRGIAPVSSASGEDMRWGVDEGAAITPSQPVPLPPEDTSATIEAAPASTADVVVPVSGVSKPEATPSLDEQGIPIAWTLQVVSVAKQEKAEMLVQQLLDMGYKGYFKAVSHGEGTLYRVYVGPKFERGKVQEAKLVVDKQFRVNSIVTRYFP